MPDRKFAAWEWHGNGTARTVHVEVRMKWPDNVARDTATFYIKHEDPPLDIKSGSLTELRDMLNDELNAHYSIEWKPKLVVVVNSEMIQIGEDWMHSESESLLESAFGVEVQSWEEGTLKDGHKKHRAYQKHREDYCYAEPGSLEERFTRGTRGSHSNSVRILDDTPENRAALKAISERLNKLIEDLHGFLGAEKLSEVLRSIPIMLPAPKEAVE